MVVVPFLGFVVGQQGYLDWVFYLIYGEGPTDKARGLFSGVIAVLGVQLVIIAFVLKAFTETDAFDK